MTNPFVMAGGSIIGREHLRVGKNNQDAYGWEVTETGIVAIVCDGCGSGTHSEVGAKLGARLVVQTLQRLLESTPNLEDEQTWQTLQQQLLHQFGVMATQLGGDRVQTVRDYFLFTIVGAVITPSLTALFALGDGVMAVNEQVIRLGPFANNAPPYLGYGLLDLQVPELLQLKVLQLLPTDSLQSLLIGTDGVADLMQVANQPLPGRSELVGDIAQFWQDDRYFRNPDQVRRRLSLMNREVTTVEPTSQQCQRQAGLLPDDTTLITLRRQEARC